MVPAILFLCPSVCLCPSFPSCLSERFTQERERGKDQETVSLIPHLQEILGVLRTRTGSGYTHYTSKDLTPAFQITFIIIAYWPPYYDSNCFFKCILTYSVNNSCYYSNIVLVGHMHKDYVIIYIAPLKLVVVLHLMTTLNSFSTSRQVKK